MCHRRTAVWLQQKWQDLKPGRLTCEASFLTAVLLPSTKANILSERGDDDKSHTVKTLECFTHITAFGTLMG